MNDLLNFLINFTLTYFLIRLALTFFNINQKAKEFKKAEIKKYLDNLIHSVTEEQIGNQIYWYDKDKESFITQGETRNDIVENLKKYYNNHVFILNEVYILSEPDWIPTANKKIQFIKFDR